MKLTDYSHYFSTYILNILIENRRTTRAERVNNNINLVILKPGNIFMVRTAIKSDKKKEKFVKVYYVVRGPYQILRNTGHGSYFVKKLHILDSPELKCMSYDLCRLPSSLKPCEPVDTTDTRYINKFHDPLTKPLTKALHIE